MDITYNTASVMTLIDCLMGFIIINHGKAIRFSVTLASPLALNDP